jgi:Family of unknown function (DUF6232)
MKRIITIRESTVISGSNIEGSNITTVSSRQMTEEMWEKIFTIGKSFGKSDQQEDLRKLKEQLDAGNLAGAKSIWPKVKSFLQNFANISEIISTLALILH